MIRRCRPLVAVLTALFAAVPDDPDVALVRLRGMLDEHLAGWTISF